MSKLLSVTALVFFVTSLPAVAQTQEHREHSSMQHLGGHWRHSHRDWSGAGGRGHVHNVCWEWDHAQGWVWTCNR